LTFTSNLTIFIKKRKIVNKGFPRKGKGLQKKTSPA